MLKVMGHDDWDRRDAAQEFIRTVEADRPLAAGPADLPPGRALDPTAGEGYDVTWLAEPGWTVRAFDLSDVAIGKGRRLAAAWSAADGTGFQVADLRGHTPEIHRVDVALDRPAQGKRP